MDKHALRIRLLVAFSSLLLCVCVMEIYLRIYDPLGMDYLARDMREMSKSLEGQSGFWLLKPGHYEFSDSSATVLENHARLVPDADSSDCQIVAIGDSFTFGLWVNDEETWVNQLARQLLEVELINAGVPGYNSPQLVRAFSRFPDVDGYLYLIVDNDHISSKVKRLTSPHDAELYVTAYIKVSLNRMTGETTTPQWEQFWQDFAQIADRDNILMFTYNHALSEPVTERYPEVIWLDWTPEPIAALDGHPTPRSHVELAGLMLPYVSEFVREVCDGL